MRVKLRTILAGPSGNGWPGDTITVPDAMGQQLVAGGCATLVDRGGANVKPQIETAAGSGAPETRDKPKSEDKEEGEASEPPAVEPVAETVAATEVATDEPARDDHDPTLEELGIDGHDAELLEAAGLTTRSKIEACEDLTAIKGIGPKTAAEIFSLIRISRE